MGGLGVHALDHAGTAGRPGSVVHRLDPRAKVVGLLGITLAAAVAPRGAWVVPAACLVALAGVAWWARVPATVVWRRARVVLPLVLLAAAVVPFVGGGPSVAVGPVHLSVEGLRTFGAVAAAATVGTLSAVLLTATTAFPDVLRALERLRVPRAFTLTCAFMYRYLFVLGEEVGRMRAALAARGFRPRTALGAAAVGRLATALFLRGHARGERVYLAMCARGFCGVMPAGAPGRLGRAEAGFLAALGALVVPVSVWAQVA
ncbi:MAG: cobalt ECF transporter T component CbiQ [Thermoleophilia bacterium]|jgi:cobalt/nickel transport system permease protein|nr:cobalt ECF transporter T component CbiQ [Thermoleophilia bacterium]